MLNALIFDTQPQPKITNSYTDTISTHEPNSHAIHISITKQFENKIDEIEFKKHTTYSGVIILLHIA